MESSCEASPAFLSALDFLHRCAETAEHGLFTPSTQTEQWSCISMALGFWSSCSSSLRRLPFVIISRAPQSTPLIRQLIGFHDMKVWPNQSAANRRHAGSVLGGGRSLT